MTSGDLLTEVAVVFLIVIGVLLAIVLFRALEVLNDARAITRSARKTTKVAEVVAEKIVTPVASVVGVSKGVEKAIKMLIRESNKKEKP
jgi:hypothetical protein